MRRLCFLVMFLLLCASVPALSEAPSLEEALAQDVLVRLHVIANSDTAEDQHIKLLVRDALLNAYGAALSCAEPDAVRERIALLLPEMSDCARAAARAAGFDGPVTIGFDREQFPTRSYEGVQVPAGTYDALCVRLGDAAGQNWWCVMYPPLCLLAPDLTEAAALAQPSQAQQTNVYPFESAFLRWLRSLPFWHKED
ncbi:MAG TPA: stage II sporulation protein R [Clostridia bacterium]|nr:stage II sporulation protein R [Clostridia bacterium]